MRKREMSDFGELLKRLRQSANLTQKQLGDRLHISKSMVCYYERLMRPPSADVLIQVADAFNVSVDYLLGREKKEMTLDLSGFPDKDVEFLRGIAQFLKGKNEEQEKSKEQGQKKNKEQEQKANEEQDKDTAANC